MKWFVLFSQNEFFALSMAMLSFDKLSRQRSVWEKFFLDMRQECEFFICRTIGMVKYKYVGIWNKAIQEKNNNSWILIFLITTRRYALLEFDSLKNYQELILVFPSKNKILVSLTTFCEPSVVYCIDTKFILIFKWRMAHIYLLFYSIELYKWPLFILYFSSKILFDVIRNSTNEYENWANPA